MSEPNNVGEKTLTVSPKTTLSLKRPVEQGTVRQSFSHGRTKQVVVEKVKRRVLGPGEAPAREAALAPAASAGLRPATPTSAAAQAPRPAMPAAPQPTPQPAVAKAPTPAAPATAPTVSPKPVDAPAANATPQLPEKPAAPAPAVASAPAEVVVPKAEVAAPAVAQAAPAAMADAPSAAVARPATSPASRPTSSSIPSRAPQQSARPAAPAARGAAPQGAAGRAAPAGAPAPGRGAPPSRPASNRPQTGVVLRTLTEEEREARARALVGAKSREEEDRRRAETDAKLRAEREARDALERDAAEARKREEDTRRAHEAEARRRAEDEAKRRLPPGEGGGPATASAARPGTSEGGLTPVVRRPLMTPAARLVVPRPSRSGPQKDRGRLTVTSATTEQEDRTRSVAAFRRRTQRMKGFGAHEAKEKLQREVVLPETITIQELSSRMSERAVDVIKLLMKQGHMAKITDVIDADMAQLIAEELGHSVRRVAESDVEEGLFDEPDEDTNLVTPPARRDHHGPRRSRQDVAARCHSAGQCRIR